MKRLITVSLLCLVPFATTQAVAAYPQTKPKAGQFCKKAHRGAVAWTPTHTKVKCVKKGTRSKWVKVPLRTPIVKKR